MGARTRWKPRPRHVLCSQRRFCKGSSAPTEAETTAAQHAEHCKWSSDPKESETRSRSGSSVPTETEPGKTQNLTPRPPPE